MLSVRNLHAGYGDTEVLQGIDLDVNQGEVVAIIGANGVGKTTLLRTISGLLAPTAGSVTFKGQPIGGMAAHAVVEHGVVMVPEGRRLFQRMSVRRNLEVGAYVGRARPRMAESLREVYDIFPILQERGAQLAGTLSGGQQQMCAIGRGLMALPELLMLDEVSLGLAPIAVKRVYEAVRAIRDRGITLVIVEQNVSQALRVADRAYVIGGGRVVLSGTGRELSNNNDVRRAYLGLGLHEHGETIP
ncbi:ATP-binding cassette domain-containing protein [Pseudoroseomonas wenyumeiae]|uniref:ABC transporter ATP-binding protein n=1 Tax=Teichococcus wenyumeiae TaxID=2478470 RepID=A0A3A9JQ38_9PROT|nr:ABC transporter ATP-binding protein [Pseudoroseomonas wenyumeiae]RKK05924.1 ABC transporter ATP-binding protein [Pseudoroseomonas wenyumeiae]RMI19852.1 ATP-binding cassette domain-containing protein [Pseudoroseomonas wenyumeiae]